MQDVHGVDFLEGAALCLDHEEVDDEEEQDEGDGEDETVEVVDAVSNQRGAEGDDEVEEPVGCCGKTHAGSTVAGGVQLSDNGPDKRSPRGGKGSNEQASEDNHNVSGLGCAERVLVVELVVSDEGVDEEAGSHPSSTSHHSLAATDILNNPESRNGCSDVDSSENDGGNVRVAETGSGEDGCAIVEEVVGTGKLLTSLEDHSEQSAVQHAGAGEDFVPWVVTTSGFSLKLLLNLGNLRVDKRAVRVDAIQASHVGASLVNLALAVCVTRRLWEEQDGAAENDSPESGKTVGNAPLSAAIVALLRAVIDHVRSPDTKGDEQLVRRDSCTTDPLRNGLGLVHGYDS